MSQSEPTPTAQPIALPRLTGLVGTLSALLILFGGITLLSTQPRDYFERATNQAALGAGMLLLGILLLLMILTFAGVRSMLQQHADLVRR